jgi:hypothetical protein
MKNEPDEFEKWLIDQGYNASHSQEGTLIFWNRPRFEMMEETLKQYRSLKLNQKPAPRTFSNDDVEKVAKWFDSDDYGMFFNSESALTTAMRHKENKLKAARSLLSSIHLKSWEQVRQEIYKEQECPIHHHVTHYCSFCANEHDKVIADWLETEEAKEDAMYFQALKRERGDLSKYKNMREMVNYIFDGLAAKLRETRK